MSDETRDQGDRGLVRIARSDRGRTWAVTARVGDTAEELLKAYQAAREIEERLKADDPPRPDKRSAP